MRCLLCGEAALAGGRGEELEDIVSTGCCECGVGGGKGWGEGAELGMLGEYGLPRLAILRALLAGVTDGTPPGELASILSPGM